jgi:hypothetical protein
MNHITTVEWIEHNHGYPYRAHCDCGWQSNTYAAAHAAQNMADNHIANVEN